MKNIFKSYMKAFIKAWVETLGTVLFLMIFTMLIFGMLSTPLQLSLKSSSVKKETNMWQEQWQNNGVMTDEFIEEYIWNNKEMNFKYDDMNFKLAIPDEWFSTETKKLIKDYSKEIVNGQFENKPNNIEELIRQEEIETVKKVIYLYYICGDKYVSTSFRTEENKTRTLKVEEIFTKEAKDQISGGKQFNYKNRNFKNYVVYSILNQLKNQSNGEFQFELFLNANFQMLKGADDHFVYNLSNATALGGTDEYNINNVVLEKGRLPEKRNEIVISSGFAKKQNKKIGDKLNLGVDQKFEGSKIDKKTVKEFDIVGIGSKYSALTPLGFSSFKDSIKNYSQIFVHESFFSTYEEEKNTDSESGYSFNEIFLTNNYKLNATSGFKLDFWAETYISKNTNNYNLNEILTSNILSIDENNQQKLLSVIVPGTTMFKESKSHTSIKQLINLYIITWIYIVIGIILFLLGFMFILFVLKKEINNTRKQLGVFKSLGYKTTELTWVFSVKTFLTMIIGIGIGYLLSFPFQIDSATKQFNTFVIFDYQTIYTSPVFLFIIIVIIPLLFAGLSYLIIFRFLNEGALALLTTGPKKGKSDYIVLVLKIIFFPALIYSFVNWLILKSLKNKNKGFTFRMQHAFVSAGKGKFALIMGLFLFSSFLFTLQLRAMPVITNMIEGGYNIYSKEVDHTYNFNKAMHITAKSKKISKDITREDYGIKFTNIKDQKVEDYVKNSNQADSIYQTTNNFSKLMNIISDIRDSSSNWGTTEATLFSLIALNFPLDKNPSEINIKEIVKPMDKSILTIKPEEMGGIFLDDIGKFACISPFAINYKGSCGDIESFKKYIIDYTQNQNTSSENYATKDMTPVFSNEFLTLMSTFAKMQSGVNSLISVNNVIFNGNKEALQTSLSYHITNNSEVDIENSLIKLIDTTSEIGGDARSVVNFKSVKNSQWEELRENNDEYLNGIISYRLSKILNKKVGDTFDIIVGKDVLLKIRIAAINENDTLMQDIYLDYTTTLKKVNKSDSFDQNDLMFNSIVSTKKASYGKVDLQDIAGSQKNFTYSRDTYTMASTKNEPWLASILAPSVGDYKPTSPKSRNFFMSSSVITLPILKSVINQILGKMTNAMLLYILIDVVLLIILLIVIMNIIITDSINVITIMRSLGYTNAQINWMVMGKYVSGAAISYIFAFFASIGVWKLIQIFVWGKFKVLIALPSLPWIPFVSAIILGAILYIGWMAAMMQIKKRPLTLLVN
ncbi:ABC transporter permease [Spiroplasma floricola]|uniref:ABC transporter permease n=1 Tax=Spiroplasma floricola 23-6 TaxID=1336749 RepID=A0A2K8SET9_9MOLU|nr:ABC transporter permease [Spiroplasma floricola]AUB31942.1 ABC transporter permease [Spiroplasma floricola 23-6]